MGVKPMGDGVNAHVVTPKISPKHGRAGPLVGDDDGAEALWTALSKQQWQGQRVLLPTVPGGRRMLGQCLRDAGAIVEEIDAYRMLPRSPDRIRADSAATCCDFSTCCALAAMPLTEREREAP